jgi:hypothetical protein
MTDPQQELDRLNELPVNQHAKRLLQSEGESPDPSQLFLLQLCQWALRSGEVVVQRDPYPSLLDNLEAMSSWEPQASLAFLLGQTRDEEAVSQSQVLEHQDPASLALFLLQLMQQRLSQASPI